MSAISLEGTQAHPILSCYHVDYSDSLFVLSDIVAGVIHVISSKDPARRWTIEEGQSLTQEIIDVLDSRYAGNDILPLAVVAEMKGVAISDLDADNVTRPHLSAAHFKPQTDTVVVSGQLRVHSLVDDQLRSNIVPFIVYYDVRARRRLAVRVIPVDDDERARLISESSCFVTDDQIFIREVDRSVLDAATGREAPLFTSYSSDVTRVGQDIIAGADIVSDFGYGLQQNLPTRLDNGQFCYTSAPTPAMLMIDPHTCKVKNVDYSSVIRSVAPLWAGNRYTGERMERRPPNAFLCTGFQFRDDLAAAVITDWNTSSSDSIVTHVVVARRDHLRSTMLFVGEMQPAYDSLQPVKVVTWLPMSNQFLVVERHRATKDWYLSMYQYQP